MLNFLELKNTVASLIQRSTTNTTYLADIGTWLNFAQDTLSKAYDYYTELNREHDFSSVADREDYPMPSDLEKLLRVYDITNNKPLSIGTREEYFDSNIANIADATTDIPQDIMLFGISGIEGVIGSSGSTIQIKSSSSSDAGIIVRIEGYLDSNKSILGYENITLTGTSYVAGTTTFYGITKLSKSGDTTGYITMADSSNAVLGYMDNIERVVVRKVAKLGKIPDDAYDYRILYKCKIRKMVNDYDYPFIDADTFLINEAYGYALAKDKETLDRAVVQWNKAKEHLAAVVSVYAGDLGPDHQEKIYSACMQAHRM